MYVSYRKKAPCLFYKHGALNQTAISLVAEPGSIHLLKNLSS